MLGTVLFRASLLAIAVTSFGPPVWSGGARLIAQQLPSPSRIRALTEAERLLRHQPELESHATDHLRVISLFKAQLRAELEGRGAAGEDRVERFVQLVYRPYQTFWEGYVGDEVAFVDWMHRSWDYGGDPRWEIPFRMDFEALIAATAERLETLTARKARGDWYLVYGPGWTNMGGLGSGVMLVDFYGFAEVDAIEGIRFTLPHELNHLLFHEGHSDDPAAGTLLFRILNEGFAVWVNHRFWEEGSRIERSLGYSREELEWARANEAAVRAGIEADLESRERDTSTRWTARAARPWPEGPGALGYFVGLRIVEAYLARHGPDSWRDLYEIPASEIVRESGYFRDEVGR